MSQLIIIFSRVDYTGYGYFLTRVIKNKEIVDKSEWVREEFIIDKYNIKLGYPSWKFENINDKNEKIKEFDEIITYIDEEIYVYFKGKDY